ncbi:hypothetical protein KJ780_01460, partial [Candidatus Micrarchaeota archaeon]|nr:hypothetical protein [Candidatus Micrarchaeota archaeon]
LEWTSVLKTRTSQPIPGVFLILNTVNPSFWGSELNGRFMKCYIPLPDKDSLVNVLQSTLPTDSGIDAAEVLATVNKNLVSRQIVETVRALVNLGIPLNTQTLIGALETLSELPNTSPNYYKPIVKDFGDDSRLLSVWTR